MGHVGDGDPGDGHTVTLASGSHRQARQEGHGAAERGVFVQGRRGG